MKDKILLVVICILVVISVILGGKLLYNNHKLDIERYNENVLDFAVELIKGNKNIDNITMADFSEETKSSMIEYFNTRFYTEDEEVVIDVEVDIIDSVISEINSIVLRATIDGVLNTTLYEQYIQEAISNRYKTTVADVDSVILWEYYYESYDRGRKETNDFILKDGKLSIMTSELSFNDGTCRKYYNGFPIDIYRDILDKLFISEIRESEKYQSISIVYAEEGKKEIIYYLKDYLDNNYSFICKYKMGKIVDIEFK